MQLMTMKILQQDMILLDLKIFEIFSFSKIYNSTQNKQIRKEKWLIPRINL